MSSSPEQSDIVEKIRCKKFYGIKRPIPLTRRRKSFKFVDHVCGSECSSLERRLIEGNSTRFKVTDDSILMPNESPYLVPLYFEFKRKNDEEEDCGYLTPCGIEMYSMEEIYRYLKISESKLNVNQFTLTARIQLYRDHSYFKVYAMRRDISRGVEPTPIQVINEFEPEFYPEFEYIKERQFAIDPELLKSLTDKDELKSCDCEDDCSNSNCKCRQLTIEENSVLNPNNQAGYTFNRLIDLPGAAIYECNDGCKCKKNCLNRVVQNGIKVRLQVFKTRNRGFGVRTLHDIPNGTFVCSYEGKIVKNTRTHLEDENAYLMNLSYKYCYDKISEEFKKSSQQTHQDSGQTNEDKKVTVPKKRSREEIYRYITIHDLTRVSDIDSSENDSTFSDLTISDFADLTSSDDSEHALESFRNFAKSASSDDETKQSDDLIEKSDSTSQTKEEERVTKKLKIEKEPDQQVDSNYLIDAQDSGNVARFINHSCNPNLACQSVFISTQNPLFVHFSLFTIKDVKAFTELSFNYFVGDEKTEKDIRCKCNSSKCKSKRKKEKKTNLSDA